MTEFGEKAGTESIRLRNRHKFIQVNGPFIRPQEVPCHPSSIEGVPEYDDYENQRDVIYDATDQSGALIVAWVSSLSMAAVNRLTAPRDAPSAADMNWSM